MLPKGYTAHVATPTPDWRKHYANLLRDGEAKRLAGSALGLYIAQRMTNAELIAMAREYDLHKQGTEAARADENPQQRLL